jgi:DNA-binding MltR family transcriptional regulator
MTSTAVETELPIMVEMTVKLSEQGDIDDVAMRMDTLGQNQLRCFERLGHMSDLVNSISNQRKAVELTDDGHPNKPMYFTNLGISQLRRFERLGNMSDLEQAISNKLMAVELTDDRHPSKALRLMNLGVTQRTRFERLGNISDLENAISNQREAAELTDDSHPHRPKYLTNLGISQLRRFKRLGNLSDLEDAISNQRQAVELTDYSHPDQPAYLSNLGDCHQARFERLGDLSDLENAISSQQKAVELTDDGHPSKALYLMDMGASQQARFERLGNLSDLENAISNVQKAAELTDEGHPDQPMYLSTLGNCQLRRFERFGDMSDLKNAILNQQRAVELTSDGNLNQAPRLTNLGISQETLFECLGNLSDLDNAISNQRKAVELTDNGHPSKAQRLMSLGISQETRFERLGDISDLDNAISNQHMAVLLTDDGHPYQPMYLSNLGISQKARFERLGNMSDLKNAIENAQRAVSLTDDGHPSKAPYLLHLGNYQHSRFENIGDLLDLENAISNQQEALELTDDGHPDRPKYLTNLGISQRTRFEQVGNIPDLTNAISNVQKAVALTDDGHPRKAPRLMHLGICQQTRFELLGDLSDLENAILNARKAVELTDDGHPTKPIFLFRLGTAQKIRFERFGDSDDLAACVLSYKAAAQLKAAQPSDALLAARQWAEISHLNDNLLSALDGYRTALELLPKVAWLGLDTNSRQHKLLEEKSENLGCLAATCAIQLGHLEEAVELLDLGRSIFWQQASSLRSDLETLREENLSLAEKLESVGRQLDAGNFFSSGFITTERNVDDDQRSTEDIGKERRQLVGQWEKLVDEVRQLPRLKYFLKPIPFHQLRQAVSTGQAVIINVSERGVDALIFSTAGHIDHVPLPKINQKKLAQSSGSVIRILNRSSDARAPEDARATQQQHLISSNLQVTLRMVWHTIIVPIFNRIHIPLESVHQPQSRIWWYPTGPLTFIPIHAAGPHKFNGTVDVSRIVISSYVTTLDSLLQAQTKKKSVPTGQMKLLAVSQPNTPGQSPLPQSTHEVLGIVQLAFSAGWEANDIVRLHDLNATVSRVSDALDTCSWAHFACHGSHDPVLGTKSALALHDGYLELAQLASKRLSIGQFAFLSACHAASGLKELPGEAMHLAAGLQFAGFPSVIATLWSIRDDDAPKVADHTYRYLFRNGIQGLEPSEAATALNLAILRLREDPDVTVDRWAPFIHFGI